MNLDQDKKEGFICNHTDLSACVASALEKYFRDLDGEKPNDIFEMVRKCVERPMLETVLKAADGNQTLAAEMLGINRNTLRKKLIEFQLIG
ncbi:MAG: Fis family transcriptional regulator [Candidatus Accumulibacter sp.]|jgi:Fis family transcriptional regulator|nr:Fis family transcriptional regulator [Accumulibacter sp.]